MKRLVPAALALLLLCAIAGPTAAQPAVASLSAASPAASAPRAEARALWVNRWEFSTPASIAHIMRNAERGGFNLVYFQVRGPSDARYPSRLDPCSPLLCGRLGGTPHWDPLEVAVREAHARGLELHAWINALSGWESDEPGDCRALVPSEPGQPDHILIRRPEWAMHDARGRAQPCPNGQEYVYLSPAHPGVRTHLARVAADVVRRYGVDGVHLDRIRYPGRQFGRDSAALAQFGRDADADPAGWRAFRRSLVERTVAETADSVRAVRRVPLSAAVWPIYDRERFGWPSSSGVDHFFQDTWGWARAGVLDAAVPMTYFYVADEWCSYRPRRRGLAPNPDWSCMVADHVAGMRPTGRHLYAAVLSKLPEAEIERQIRLGREHGVQGFSFYSYASLEQRDLWDWLRAGSFREPATVPPMPWRAGGAETHSRPDA